MTENINNQDNRKPSSFMERFCVAMDRDFADLGGLDIAVGVSGGADSLALCFSLSEYLPDITIHALTVDHGLRAEAADEARHVSGLLESLSNVSHHILEWHHEEKLGARIQETARAARYDLMHDFMAKRGITHLFLGHHMDDQGETFLFRLAKGSGLDGLSCMSQMYERAEGFILCRPLLGMGKQEMVEFCENRGISYVDDPSNKCEAFARVRLRKSMDILAAEGLSSKRLGVTAARLARARRALDIMAGKVFDEAMIDNNLSRIVFKSDVLLSNPEEIVLRVILKAMSVLRFDTGYGARLERVESLCADLIKTEAFRKRTLGGIIFERDDIKCQFIASLENPH